ncbi:hypothetical protein EDB80DRAFT_625396 [Ilyonectria destructans]|nr:hypothetical protein EDB80DRAFT_625396 [Ilyonectria destructans]
MSGGPEQPLRVLSLDGGGIRGLSSLMILAKVMEDVPTGQGGEEAKPCDHFRCITGAGMGGVLALLLGCLKLTVSQSMSEYWKLSSLMLQREWYGAAPPLFDIRKLEMVMDQIVRKYYPKGLPLKDPTRATKVFVYGVRKGEGVVCIRTYPSPDEEVSDITTIPQAAAAISAARGLFAEVTLPAADGSNISFLDKGYPLGLIDPTELAVREVEKLFPDEPIHAIISIGAGDIEVDDIHDLLLLAYPPPFLPILSMFQHRRAPEDEMSRAKEGLRDPKKIYDTIRNQHQKSIRSIPLGPYRRLQIEPVKDVGPNDFLSVKEVSEKTEKYLHGIQQQMTQSLLLGGSLTVLHWAAWTGDEATLDLLSLTTGDLDNKDEEQRTPISYAAENGHEDGRTPLSWAAQEGHEAVIKLLLENGADLESKDNSGWTPLSLAAQEEHEAVVKLLVEKGADLESKDNSGRTPLSWAAREGHAAVIKLLESIRYSQRPKV